MIDKGQVFVRGKNKNGEWDNIDVMDLDDESFRRFIVTILANTGTITYLQIDGNGDIKPLREKNK